jgi:hypothetical protein
MSIRVDTSREATQTTSSTQNAQEGQQGSLNSRDAVIMPAMRDDSEMFSYDPSQTFLTTAALESMKAAQAAQKALTKDHK